MVSIISLLFIVTVSLLIIRVATTALTLTGVSKELARFQARSAFTGVGYTTTEAESMVQHPARRRIITALMILGNAGFVTAMSSLVLSFVDISRTEMWMRLGMLAAGTAALWGVASSRWLERRMHGAIQRLIERWPRVQAQDYANILRLSGDYSVRELRVHEGDWLLGDTLGELRLRDEGVLVLGILRDGKYFGAPTPDTRLKSGDNVILYGRDDTLGDLDDRRADYQGERAHQRSRRDQERAEAQERQAKQEASAGD